MSAQTSRGDRRATPRLGKGRPTRHGRLVAACLWSGVALGLLIGLAAPRLVQDARSRAASEELSDAAGPVVPDASGRQGAGPDWATLRQVNPDVIAWMRIEGTTIDHPVVRSEAARPTWYLSHAFDGSADVCGSPYADVGCEADDAAVVVFGHNCWPRTDLVFSPLREVYEQERFLGLGELDWWTPDRGLVRLTPLLALLLPEGTLTSSLRPEAQMPTGVRTLLAGLLADATAVSPTAAQDLADARRYVLLSTCSPQGGERSVVVFVAT